MRTLLGFLTLLLGIVLFGVYTGGASRYLQGHTGSGVARAILFQPYSFPWDVHALYYVAALLGAIGMVMTRTYSICCALLGSAFLLGYGASAAGWAARNGPAGSLAAPLRGVGGALGSDLVFLGMGISALVFGLLLRGAAGSGAKLTIPRSGGGKPGSSGGIRPPAAKMGSGLPTCPACGKAVLRGAKICRHCGATIEPASASAPDPILENPKMGAPPPEASTSALLDRLENMPDEPDEASEGTPPDLPPDPDEKPPSAADDPPSDPPAPSGGVRRRIGGPLRVGGGSAMGGSATGGPATGGSATGGSAALLAVRGPNPAAFFSPLLGLCAAGAVGALATQGATWNDARLGVLACGAVGAGAASALLGLTGLGKSRGKRGGAFLGLLLGTLGGGAGGALLFLQG
ncbi:MAG: zinc ribbon domain-containing protein [Planctomycetes bacterium]|nr:zinc ribbon domain-containing protein [Planctomycetota bacterium]